jgi:beta-lactamase regulating signal transducer with metallopeptidase domain
MRILSAATGAMPLDVLDALRSFAYRFAHAAAPIAVTAAWQGAVVAAGLALCLQLAPRVGAAHRFAAWAAGFSVLVALPFVPALSRLLSRLMAASAGAGSSLDAASLSSPSAHAWLAHPILEISDRWSLAIAAVWVVLALARAIDLAIHTARLRWLWKSAAPLRGVLALDESTGNGARKRFEICTTRELDRPGVIGFFAPRILIPEWLLERLTEQELGQVVLHEAEHLRRRDDWTNLLQKLCLVVFPLNPALMFVERRLCREREMACDEGVVRRTQAPRAYAACLAGLAERHMEHRAAALSLGARAKALTLSAFERRPELARRVHSILARRGAVHPLASRALLGAVGCALAVGAVVLARCPQLVAFVPAEPKITADTAQMVPAGLQTDAGGSQLASHFRAINAMAIVPDRVERNATHCRARLNGTGVQANEPKLQQPAGYRETLVSARTSAARPDAVADAAHSESAAPRELIVLTAFEQVQTSGDVLGDRVYSDYGADANGRSAYGGAGRVTITRLVFRVYPLPAGLRASAGARESDGPGEVVEPVIEKQPTAIQTSAHAPTSATASSPAAQTTNQAAGKPAGPTSKGAANSLTGQPHAVALGNGWFVIQL